MSYSASFRAQVLNIQEAEGLTNAATAQRFGIGIASLVRWKKCPSPAATRRRPWLKIDLIALARDLHDWPDAYHHERAARLGVSTRGIGTALKRMGVTHKKNSAPSQGVCQSSAAVSGDDQEA